MNKCLKNLECEAKDISCKGRCQTEINLNCDFGTFYIEEVKELILTRIKELEEERKKIIYGVYQMEDLKANKIDAKIDELKRLLGSD